ncbi:hypothetical protein BO71DRAFT_117840 [Aspergillus ellipticus CBS 707.79]|uniref:Uncharacterized protein n=1 Tax=Aspergillus ellipticus CBS 707.79 TaxID=1448320 RepID=A0A319EDE5_9EURO|nr:hypothetical protein BO71DRAFT_117840 [Aspergillus ellipticus CBS 707.79]
MGPGLVQGKRQENNSGCAERHGLVYEWGGEVNKSTNRPILRILGPHGYLIWNRFRVQSTDRLKQLLQLGCPETGGTGWGSGGLPIIWTLATSPSPEHRWGLLDRRGPRSTPPVLVNDKLELARKENWLPSRGVAIIPCLRRPPSATDGCGPYHHPQPQRDHGLEPVLDCAPPYSSREFHCPRTSVPRIHLYITSVHRETFPAAWTSSEI